MQKNEITVEELRKNPSARSLYVNNLGKHRLAYVAGTLAMLATSLSEVLIPKCIQWTIDALSLQPSGTAKIPEWLRAHSPAETLTVIMSYLATLVLVGVIGRFAWRQFLARQTHYAGNRLKIGLWNVLRFQPMKTFERYPLGDLMNRAIGDWNASRVIHGFTLVLSFDVIFFTSLALALMLSIDWQITLLAFVFFCIVPPFIMRLAKREHDQHSFAQSRLSDLSDFISQNLRTIRLQRATRCEARWQSRLRNLSDQYAASRMAVLKTGWDIFPFATAPSLFAYAALMTLGIAKVNSGHLSVGEFVAMCSFILLMQTPLFELGDCIAEWQRGFASMRRVAEILRLESKSERSLAEHAAPFRQAEGSPTQRAVEIRHLNFTYDDSQTVLKDISLSVELGKRIGIGGEIGSGKSTLIKILAGVEQAPPDQVYIFGHDVSKLNRAWFAKNVTVVPQQSFLFAGSIRNNLCLGHEIDEASIWSILDAVEIGREVRSFEGQLDAWVGEWGINLSGGQKQRLAIARALLRPRPLLLLDDCLSAVDAKNEEQIVSNLTEVLKGQTVIWIAHRASTLKHCSTIFQLVNGVLVPVSAMKITGKTTVS